jgi:hypothetical protein
MKESFVGWYAKSPEQLKALWDEAIIVPDTNIILHLIRHSAKVRGELMSVFEQKRDALWIPYQVGLEFQRRRLDVEQQAADAYDRLTDELKAMVNLGKTKINQYRAHPIIDIEPELAALDSYLADFERRMENAKRIHPTEQVRASFNEVTELFAGKIGPKPSPEQLAAIRKEGEERYAKKIPPGFEDAKKNPDAGDKFGDLIIWKEIISKGKADKRPVIFVTDDGKSDWWHIHRGRKMGPHPELVEEFMSQTGQQFHIYELLQFLRYAGETGSSIEADTVQQIAETVLSDSAVVSAASATGERARVAKALRQELRTREFELDGLVKSLIDLPPRSAEAHAVSLEDTRHSLKVKIAGLNEEIAVLRTDLARTETGENDDPGAGVQ